MRVLVGMTAALLWAVPASAQQIGVDAQNRAWIRATVEGVSMEKVVDERGDFTLLLKKGRDAVRIAVGPEGLTVDVAGRRIAVAKGGANADAQGLLRAALARSGVLQLFRKAVAAAEIRADAREAGRGDALEETLLLDGAFIAYLLGDDAALARHGRRVARATYGLMRVSQFPSCYDHYYASIAEAFNALLKCNKEALSQTTPILYRPVMYWGCQAEYFARSQAAYYQFLSCAAIPLR
ncbi:MAG TPA: hypothetical protein VNK41_12470 [Vicinamibacterales bacterium]|nr:hypothetical protein [Vicinamibacterales bacterium]